MFNLSFDEVIAARLAFARQMGGREERRAREAIDLDLHSAAVQTRLRGRRVVELIGEACRIYDVERETLLGDDRTIRPSRARQWVMYHALAEGRSSSTGIGRLLGGRDHSTVLYNARQHGARHGLPPVSVPQSDKQRARLDKVIYEGPEPALDRPFDPVNRRDARRLISRRNIAIARACRAVPYLGVVA